MVASAAQITDTLMHQSPRISATAVAALLARLPRRQELLAPLAPTTTTRSRKPIYASPSRLVAQLINPHHLRPTLHTRPPLLLPIANTIDTGALLSLLFHRAMSTVPSATSPPTSPPAKRHKPSTSISETVANDTTESTTTMSAAAATSSNGTAVPTLEQSPSLLVKKLSDKAKLPTRGSAFAAGYDLYAAKETVIPKRGKALVDTDISIAVPAGTCTSLLPYTPRTLFLLLGQDQAVRATESTGTCVHEN